jgi:uncharacterized membrane protein YebE (DUF533 family)
MFDPKQLLDQVLGGQGSGQQPGSWSIGGARNRLDQMSGSGGFMSGAAAGGLLGLLLGSKQVRKMTGGALGYGGAAVVGALALKAYQNYQQNKAATPVSPAAIAAVPPAALPHAQPAADGGPFQLVLIRAMVGAAKADGHVDANEQQRLFSEVERLGLDAEAKAYVFDLLQQPVDLNSITSAVATPEQGAEVYLASRLAMDPDHPAERAYLDGLAARLKLPAELRSQLDATVVSEQ